jgi:hypothetical protein
LIVEHVAVSTDTNDKLVFDISEADQSNLTGVANRWWDATGVGATHVRTLGGRISSVAV